MVRYSGWNRNQRKSSVFPRPQRRGRPPPSPFPLLEQRPMVLRYKTYKSRRWAPRQPASCQTMCITKYSKSISRNNDAKSRDVGTSSAGGHLRGVEMSKFSKEKNHISTVSGPVGWDMRDRPRKPVFIKDFYQKNSYTNVPENSS